MEAVLVALFVGLAAIAFFVGRWWTVVLAVIVLGAFYTGIGVGWWGYGFGDGWQYAIAVMLGAGAVTATLGVALRSLVRPRAEQPAPGQEQR